MKGEKVKVSKSCTLAREMGIRGGAWRGKDGLHSEGRIQGGKEGKARRASLVEIVGTMSG